MDFYKNTLFIVFIVIFSITALITLLGITGVLKVQEKYLNGLFKALILELVASVIAAFASINWAGEAPKPPAPTQSAGPAAPGDSPTPNASPSSSSGALPSTDADLRAFFIGRWRVEQASGGTSANANFDYFDDGTFSGEQTQFIGGMGQRVHIEGTWQLDATGPGKFRLSAYTPDNQPAFNSRFKIIDHDHIQNTDMNYVAERVTE